jgi:N-acyl-D-aspartate/D-glutamate deacylase
MSFSAVAMSSTEPAARGGADVGIRDGRVASIGTTDEPATRTLDVDGLAIAPGFVDIHTHYDAQVLWDPMCTPSPLHGVTTVVGGNCGFTIAPLGDDADVEYIMRMMARVEGMSIDALRAGPAWAWRSFGEWLDHIDGRLGVNAGFLVGHSTMRRVVMGDAARAASPQQIVAMVALAHDAMASGALGVSSSLGEAHTDGDGNRSLPRRVTRRAAGPGVPCAARAARRSSSSPQWEIGVERIELMTEMSLAAN